MNHKSNPSNHPPLLFKALRIYIKQPFMKTSPNRLPQEDCLLIVGRKSSLAPRFDQGRFLFNNKHLMDMMDKFGNLTTEPTSTTTTTLSNINK